MEKFLENREVLSCCLCTGKTHLPKEEYVTKVSLENETYFVLPNGDKHGSFEERSDRSGQTLHQSWKDGQLHGPWSIKKKDGEILKEGTYVNGKKNGPEIQIASKVLRFRREFLDGELHGLLTIFRRSGAVDYVAEYSNGKKEGLEVHFDSEGKLREAFQNTEGERLPLPLDIDEELLTRMKYFCL